MKLSHRDKAIMNFIRKQDFCFYKDVIKSFFPSYASGSRRLNMLSNEGYLSIEAIKVKILIKVLDTKSLSVIGRRNKIVFLKKSHLSDYEYLKLSRFKINHQVLLFSLKEKLQSILKIPAVFENEIRDRRGTLESGGHEPYPDFYFEGENFKLAVELELNIKSQNRYDLKTINYSGSSFSHVLYVVGSLKKKDRLLEYFAYKDGIGISHYAEPETVFSYSYGKSFLLEWLKREGNK